MYLAFLSMGIAILISIGPAMDSSRAAEGSKITIAYSSNVYGYMEPCG